MRFFASREAMTTAEPPEPLIFQFSDSIMKKNHQKIGGPSARHSVYSVYSVDSSFVFIRVHSWFQMNHHAPSSAIIMKKSLASFTFTYML